ncbi:MAG TPA: hypothetical protein VF519_03045 [Mycobacteriales bacterium]|jgi:hypothetical protein
MRRALFVAGLVAAATVTPFAPAHAALTEVAGTTCGLAAVSGDFGNPEGFAGAIAATGATTSGTVQITCTLKFLSLVVEQPVSIAAPVTAVAHPFTAHSNDPETEFPTLCTKVVRTLPTGTTQTIVNGCVGVTMSIVPPDAPCDLLSVDCDAVQRVALTVVPAAYSA